MVPSATTLAQDAEDRTLAAMCHRGLAESAVLYAASQLKNSEDPSLQAKWTMRLMECHAQAALCSPLETSPSKPVPSQAGQANSVADEHWAAPNVIYTQTTQAQPQNPRLPWLAWQDARCDLLHAQATLANFLAVPSDARLREAALARVREVMSKSESLLDDIQRRQPLAARQGRQGGSEAPAEQLAKLSIDTALLQCDALLIRARLYDSGSSDRVAAATEVDKRAAEVFARSDEDWSAREQLIAARAIAQLELGKTEQALRVLESLARDSANPQTRIRAAMIVVEQLASQGATSRAQPLLTNLERAGAGAELALAKLQLALADVPTNPQEAKQRALNNLVNEAKAIGKAHGEYWRNRADALLVGSVSSSSVEDARLAVDLMLVEVRQLLANNDSAAATEKLLQFRNNEAAAGRGVNAIQLASKAWALLGRDAHWPAAIAALEPTLLQFRDAAGAAEAHLFVISAQDQLLRGDPKNKEYGQAYEAALRRQLELWPDAIVSDDAEAMLAQWLTTQGKRVQFAQVLQARLEGSQDPEVGRRCIAQWLEQVLQLRDTEGREASIASMQATTTDLQVPELASSSQIAILVAEAFSNWPDATGASEVQKRLAALRRQSTVESDQQLIRAAELLRAIRFQERENLTHLTDAWKPGELKASLRNGLTQAWVEAIDEVDVASQRVWIDVLRVDEAWIASLRDSPSQLDQALGLRFVAWKSNASEGLSGLEKLCNENPRDGTLRLLFAQALAASGLNRAPESTQLAKQIAGSSAAGSELNLAARWRIIRNEMLLGNQAAAAQMARIVLATLPEQATIWQPRFESAAK